MTQGFYEQLGVQPNVDAETLRQAYHRQVARLVKRRKELAAQRGDTGQLDLARAQLDEAWAVVSIPARRQRYDALLGFLDSGEQPDNADALWDAVGSSLVPPSVMAAVRLLSAATSLDVPSSETPAPEPAGFAEPTAPTLAPPTLVSPTAAIPTAVPAASPSASSVATTLSPVLPRPNLQIADVSSPLKVVDGPGSAVIVLPSDAPRQRTLSSDEVGALTDAHGYSGGLLRAVREAKGITLQEVADTTRISVRYLQAIEADAHERLPSAPFVKGYIREVARLLKLDDDAVVSGYMRRF